MKGKILIGLAMVLIMTVLCAGALADNVFRFEERSVELFEGESILPELIREGAPAEGGTLTFTVGNKKTISADSQGKVTALKKGQTTLKATLKNGKKTWTASLKVEVLRKVTAVTLSTTQLSVYRPDDATVSGLLRQETEHDVIVIPAGKSIELKATCTPSDASSKKVVFTSSDEGVLSTGNASARALQAGECDLTVASAQNPEVTRVYHVLVTQPVTQIHIEAADGKTVNNETAAEFIKICESVKNG